MAGYQGIVRALLKGLAVVSMLGSNLSESSIELMRGLSGEGSVRVGNGLLVHECPEEREQHVFYLISIFPPPAMVQGERLRPQTDISRLKVSDVCGHGREVGDFGAKETEEP